MCGCCTESIALNVLEQEIQGISPTKEQLQECTPSLYFYLREATDFAMAFDHLTLAGTGEKIVPLEKLPAEIILLRALEIRAEQEFSDSTYQALVGVPLFSSLIDKVCGKKLEYNFAQATTGMDMTPLYFLYDADTYLLENRAFELVQTDQILPAYHSLLKHYTTWWLKGVGLRKNDLVQRMKETGFYDPIDDIAEGQYERFNLLLRALHFSVLTIGKFEDGKNVLWELAHNNPFGVSDFSGADLWLQRIAALKLYDLMGFDSFIKHFPDFRITLFYYIGLKRGYTKEQKKMILEAARHFPEIAQNDFWMKIEDWNL